MNKRGKIFRLCGIIVFILTIFIFFMMTKDRVSATWISLIFLLFVEIILFCGLTMLEYLATKASQIVIRAGCGGVLLIYSIISMIVSVYYIISVQESVKLLATIQVVLFGIAAILFVVFYKTSVRIKEGSDEVINVAVKLSSIVDKFNLLSQDPSNDKYKTQLAKIAEDLRFTDISIWVPCDYEIDCNLAKLELVLLKEDDESEVLKLLESTFMLINKRKIEVKNARFGRA